MKKIIILFSLFLIGNKAYSLQKPDFNACIEKTEAAADTLILPLKTPTVFTPNYDGVNDIFIFETSGAQKVSCKIYNRWGIKAYEWEGIEGFWDGRTSAGLACPTGVYYFVVLITDQAGTVYEEKGFTHLIR